jgi:hypothetical protein
MMERISKTFFSGKLTKFLKKEPFNRYTVSFYKARNIGILFSNGSKEKVDEVKKFAQELEEEGKNVKILAFVGKNSDIPTSDIPYFTHKDISIWGEFTNNLAINFKNEPFDYIYCPDLESDLPVEAILAMCKAKCRVGKFHSPEKNHYYDLMVKIGEEEGIHELIVQMKNITKKLDGE